MTVIQGRVIASPEPKAGNAAAQCQRVSPPASAGGIEIGLRVERETVYNNGVGWPWTGILFACPIAPTIKSEGGLLWLVSPS
jgi:hypothetical protein